MLLCQLSALLSTLVSTAAAAPPTLGGAVFTVDDGALKTGIASDSYARITEPFPLDLDPSYHPENSPIRSVEEIPDNVSQSPDEDLGPHRPHGQFPPGSEVDLGPQRPQGQFPPGSEVDLGPHRPHGQFPPGSEVDLGPQRPHGQVPPQNRPLLNDRTEVKEADRNHDSIQKVPEASSGAIIGSMADEVSQTYNSYETIDIGPQRPSGQFPAGSGDLGPQRHNGQFPPSEGASSNDEIEMVEISRSQSNRRPPTDLGPHRPAGQTDPNGPPGSNNDTGENVSGVSSGTVDPLADASQTYNSYDSIDIGPQLPSGQFPPGSGDLGPQRPHGQFPPTEKGESRNNMETIEVSRSQSGREKPTDLGPHRPAGQTDPNGPPGSNNDAGQNVHQGLSGVTLAGSFADESETIDIGPQRPSGQFPPGSEDVGPQRPHGQFPPAGGGISNDVVEITEVSRSQSDRRTDLGPHRPAGQSDPNGPPGSNNYADQSVPGKSVSGTVDPLADASQAYNRYDAIDIGPQRPSGQFPPGSGDLGLQRPHGQFPPTEKGESRNNMETIEVSRSQSGREKPTDLGPHRPAGQTDPNGPPGSNNDAGQNVHQGLSGVTVAGSLADESQTIDFGPQRPSGQFPPGSGDLGPQRPQGQFPPTEQGKSRDNMETVEVSRSQSGREKPTDLGPHRPAGQTDPNGPPGSNNDLILHPPQGGTGLIGLLAEATQSYNNYEIDDLGPQRPHGQFPPSSLLDDDTSDEFSVYWNVPTFMCHKYGLSFSNLSERYGVVQNEKDVFRGRKISILYDPGLYPGFIEDDKGNRRPRNGGVPQTGDLALHLQHLERSIVQQVPEDFDGLGVIDFEAWRPVWSQNWGPLRVYQTYSIELERRKSPKASNSTLKRRAKQVFEDAAKVFFLESLELAKRVRPKGKWGYYAYPYCFNQSPNNPGYLCSSDLRKQNTQIQWLFDASTALYPSVYLSRGHKTEEDEFSFILGRLQEAKRVAGARSIVYPYLWYRYQDTRDYVSDEDLRSSLVLPRGLGMAGAVLWGSSGDMNTRSKCADLGREVDQRLGPAIRRYSRTASAAEIRELVQGRISHMAA